ncbi:MAG: type II secretion system GspH family protein [Gammaproteobacteria bacterium]|nr:type II secretion system GspH family protein [Gammaproteobacteria bacterium]
MTGRHEIRTVPTRMRGFGYIGLLILVAMMGVALAGAGEVWHTAQQREKEQELLFAGAQFRRAIAQYYANTPGKARRYPLQLEELLKDPRHPGVRRYLRKIYLDPMTGKAEWGLVTGPGGEIYGVYSRSQDAPLKQAGFRLADKDFEGRTKYSEWVFIPALR